MSVCLLPVSNIYTYRFARATHFHCSDQNRLWQAWLHTIRVFYYDAGVVNRVALLMRDSTLSKSRLGVILLKIYREWN